MFVTIIKQFILVTDLSEDKSLNHEYSLSYTVYEMYAMN